MVACHQFSSLLFQFLKCRFSFLDVLSLSFGSIFLSLHFSPYNLPFSELYSLRVFSQLLLQIGMVLSLSLHNALNDLLVFCNVDEADVLRIVVSHGARLHTDGFLQILGPSVINAAASLFAALDGVGLS